MENRKSSFFEKLADYMKIAPEREVFDTLNQAIDERIEALGGDKEKQLVVDIQQTVEEAFNLNPGSLENSFSQKLTHLSDPKKIWVLVCYALIPNQKKVLKLIGNGLKRGHIYRYQKEFTELSDNIKHHRNFKSKFEQILNTYGK
jgi:hypothetical protein